MSLFLRAYKNTDGKVTKEVYAYDFRIRKKRYAGVIGDVTRTVAKARYERLRTEARQGLLDDRAPPVAPLFKEFAARFLAHYRVGNAAASLERMEIAYRAMASTFDTTPLDRITRPQIEAYKARRDAEGKSPATINIELRVLKQLFLLAVAWKVIRTHPMEGIARLRERQPQRILSDAEEGRLLAVCGPLFKPMVILALDTGLRRGDLLALTWRDIDLRQRLITVPARQSPTRAMKHRPKAERSRLVGMTNRVFDLLVQMCDTDGDAKVFVYRYSSIDQTFARAAKAAGITGMRFHDLRHTFGTRLVQADVNLEKVRQVMGHARIATTQRYLHLSDRDTAGVVDVLNRRGDANQSPNGPLAS